MRELRFIALLAASCCAARGGDATNRVDGFSKLDQSDTLIVRFRTSGCFHEATHEFVFRRASEITVAVVQMPSDPDRAGVVTTQTNRVSLGSLTLTKSDIAGLDRLMRFYRTKHGSVSTTVDHLFLTQQRGGRTVAAEQIIDRSGQAYFTKGLTTFPDLIARLRRRAGHPIAFD